MYMYSLAGQATAVIRPVDGAKRIKQPQPTDSLKTITQATAMIRPVEGVIHIKQPILTDPVGITVHN